MYQKAGRPDKIGKPKHKGGIADNIRRLAKKNNKKKKCKSCGGKGCSKCASGSVGQGKYK